MSDNEPSRMDRRAALKWLGAAVVAFPLLDWSSDAQTSITHTLTDPDLLELGQLWGRTLTPDELRAIKALCSVIIPADDKSPAAGELHLADFIDEWVSAPYPSQQADQKTIRGGLIWLKAESQKRFQRDFPDLTDEQKIKICDDIAFVPKATPEFVTAAQFFAKMRDLTATGFYTTKEGMKDLQYRGNVSLATFDGPPREVLAYLGLA
jgi:Gluconate 2-dehydrogenase subunit 3